MQSSNLTRALLGTLADAYPTAMPLMTLAGETRCEPEALHKHLWLLQDLGAVRACGHGANLEWASTAAGLALVRPDSHSIEVRPNRVIRH